MSTDHQINLIELPFCSTDHGLPPNTESTENLTMDQIAQLLYASQSLKTPFEDLVFDIIKNEGKPPLCITSDIFFGWAVDVAKSAGTASVTFSTCGAYGTLAYISFWLNLPHGKTESEESSLAGFPDRCKFQVSMLNRLSKMADGTDLWSKYMQPQFLKLMESSAWLCNTGEEIEPLALEWLRNYIKIPVWAVGTLLPPELINNSPKFTRSGLSISRKRSGKNAGISLEKCIQWLDSHSTDSVLYISFGSQNTINPKQMMALAVGLEKGRTPFIWVIRPPIGFDLKGEFRDEWFPGGFEKRMNESNQGLLVRNWAPQLEILSHRSTGAFLSHCGWNSVMESLSRGVPIIGWPMAGEQAYNFKMLMEEMGVSVELTRGVQSVVEVEQVKAVIELAMDKNGKGEEMKKKAMEIKEQIRAAAMKGSTVKAVDDFVDSVLLTSQSVKIGSINNGN